MQECDTSCNERLDAFIRAFLIALACTFTIAFLNSLMYKWKNKKKKYKSLLDKLENKFLVVTKT